MRTSTCKGYTLLELMMVIAVISVLVTLLLPALQFGRESSRKEACASNIRQLGLASLEYEQTFHRLVSFDSPWGAGDADLKYVQSREPRWSGFIGLYPFLGHTSDYTQIHEGLIARVQDRLFAYGPYGSNGAAIDGAVSVSAFPWDLAYPPNRTQIGILKCPSDPYTMRPSNPWNGARVNYAFSFADMQVGQNSVALDVVHVRGGFQRQYYFGMENIIDGYSGSIMFGEISTPETRSLNEVQNAGVKGIDVRVQGRVNYELPQQAEYKGINVIDCRNKAIGGIYKGSTRYWSKQGTRNLDCSSILTGMTTILGPNAGSCAPINNAWGEGDGIYSAGSFHFGGAHVVMFDASVKFISDSIYTENFWPQYTPADCYSPGRIWHNGAWHSTPNWNGRSPFGTWGAMGSVSGGEAPAMIPEPPKPAPEWFSIPPTK